MNRREEIELLRGRHEIFNGISSKEMMLVSADPPGRTDTESYVAVPIEHPDAGIIHIHEWQHVFCKTRLHAREKFVHHYVERISPLRERLDKRSVTDFVTLVANALDDLRVNSIWSMVWPGDSLKVAARWQRLVAQSDPKNFIMHLIGVGLGFEHASPWRAHDELLREAARRVYRQGFLRVLATTRWLLDELLDVVDELRAPEEPPGVTSSRGTMQRLTRRRRAATEAQWKADGGRLLDRMMYQAQKARGLTLDTHLPITPDPDEGSTDKLVQAAMGVMAVDELDRLLADDTRVVNTVVSELRTRSRIETPIQALTRDLASVRIQVLERHDVEELQLSEDDERVVVELRSRFMQLMNLRRRRRSDSGETLDPQLYMDLMLGSGNGEIFVDEQMTRGFSALILPDMSGSTFKFWHTVSRACKVCAKSLAFPSSSLEVWGFSGTKTGETVMYHFQDVQRGYFPSTHQPDAWGLTPLHVAIPVAVRRLRQMPGSAQHLFVVTDGDPQHIGPVMGSALRDSVTRGVEEAVRVGINVVVLLINMTLSDDEANRMFGARWVRIPNDEEYVFIELVEFVGKAFSRYLRR